MYILKETEEFAKWYDSFKNGTPKYAIKRPCRIKNILHNKIKRRNSFIIEWRKQKQPTRRYKKSKGIDYKI